MGFGKKEIDLHGIYPDEVDYVLTDALRSAQQEGLTELILIHGKGEGVLSRSVYSALQRHKHKVLSCSRHEGYVKVSLKLPQLNPIIYASHKVTLPGKENQDDYMTRVKEKREKGRQRYKKHINMKHLKK